MALNRNFRELNCRIRAVTVAMTPKNPLDAK
jgi:hypothetical protein